MTRGFVSLRALMIRQLDQRDSMANPFCGLAEPAPILEKEMLVSLLVSTDWPH
jgi:hypothetical protein